MPAFRAPVGTPLPRGAGWFAPVATRHRLSAPSSAPAVDRVRNGRPCRWHTGAVSEDPGYQMCSAKGCRSEAAWALVWNNPKVHTPERRKTWLACDDHRAYLSDFLDRRSFLREVVPLSEFAG